VGTCGAPSPRVEGVTAESTLKVCTELSGTGMSVELPAGTAEAPVGTVEASREPSRKRKWGPFQLEVSSVLFRAPSILRRCRSSPAFFVVSASPAIPALETVKALGLNILGHWEPLRKGAAGGSKCGGGWLAVAHHGRGREAVVGGGDNSGCTSVGSPRP
jgi:hypothetical protein